MRTPTLCLLLTLGCDFIQPGECLSPGYMFGPCVNYTCAEDRLHCTQTPGGDQCTAEVAAVDAAEAATCAAWRGGLSVDANDLYYVSCQVPDDCRGGTVCSSGLCVYPRWGQVKAGQVCSWDEECVEGLVCPPMAAPINGAWGVCTAPA